ncbi:MAG: biopolymer transporter ExbD [Elusimicrobia bacterium]|nr:biopolymer transporter ExbD [Elusimicrobiota bacterium]
MIHRIHRRRIVAEMNLIPLIDVSLILVIIFMILTPVLVQSQLTVRLPASTAGSPVPVESTVRVQISRNGRIAVNSRDVRPDRLERELTLLLSASSTKTLLVQSDRSVEVEKVVRVLDIAKRLGVGKLGIAVVPQ